MKKLLLSFSLLLASLAMMAQDSVNITINLSMVEVGASPEGVFIAGGGNFGNPGDFPFTDSDGDGVWTITVRQPVGFTSFFTFTNGACGDYSCKENIAGQPCADPGNFNDRQMVNVSADTTINTCFGECTDDLVCTAIPDPVNVTFAVDVESLGGTVDTGGIYMGGNLEDPNWQGQIAMDDATGNGIWTVTVSLLPGTYEYKFLNGAGFDGEETFDPTNTAISPCTITTPDSQFTNRLVTIGLSDTLIGPYIWESCEAGRDTSTSVGIRQMATNLFDVVPTIIRSSTTLEFSADLGETKEVSLITLNGEVVRQLVVPAAQQEETLTVDGLTNGLYFIRVQAGAQTATRKVMIQR